MAMDSGNSRSSDHQRRHDEIKGHGQDHERRGFRRCRHPLRIRRNRLYSRDEAVVVLSDE
ncbi:NAC domain-containing protein 74-like [Iris pallida]|uniref:NAC domain-containing protein 74-like n=1 Tax=Iris pallida TaxID=29817 RepID=A0AAX6HXQ0_IRIPA|nr:NAC domain-containing protein 74-like [Iris pallida]KAJ6845274.1 NAC domain-containing protein 74-like [Iris pallida]